MHAACCQAYRPASRDAAVASRAATQADSADRPQRAERRRGHDAGDGDARATHRAERRHPLVAAMTEALRGLMPADAGAADRAEVKDSARAFAHELVDALRESGGARGPRHGYDDLAQRLERLAGSLGQSAATGAGPGSSISASFTSASLSVTVDANGASASLSLTSVELDVTQQTSAAGAAADTSGGSPLLAAFRRLLSALQPDAAPAGGAGSADAGKLSAFLRQLASALRGGDAPAAPASSGALVSLAA